MTDIARRRDMPEPDSHPPISGASPIRTPTIGPPVGNPPVGDPPIGESPTIGLPTGDSSAVGVSASGPSCDRKHRHAGHRATDPTEGHARILHVVANLSLAASAIAALVVAATTWYLSRGVYDPADVLVLLVQCLAIAICPTALAAGVVLHAVGAVVTALSRRRPMAPATVRSGRPYGQPYGHPYDQPCDRPCGHPRDRPFRPGGDDARASGPAPVPDRPDGVT